MLRPLPRWRRSSPPRLVCRDPAGKKGSGYRFCVDQEFTPYADGGIAVGFVDVDLPATSSGDNTSFEIGARLTGGLEWNLSGGGDIAVELSLSVGDIHDAQVVAVWTFGK